MSAEFVESKPVHKLPFKSGRDIMEAQVRSGRATVDRNDWARVAYADLRLRCPHIPEDELVRLFHDKAQSQLELIQGDAVFREYNATHVPGRKRMKAKVKPVSRVVVTSRPAEAPKATPKAKAAPPKPAAKKAPAPKAVAKKAAPKKPVKAAPKKAPAKKVAPKKKR